MTAVSATTARANLYRLIDQVNEESQPSTITGQRGNAVLVGEEDWQAIKETVFFLAFNIQHRLVDEVLLDQNVVHILRMWTQND